MQWKWPATHGEKEHIIMLGGLHTEMALWNTLGDVLEGSGWTLSLAEAEVASTGTADSMLKAAHLARTSHAHQVTRLALNILQCEGYQVSPPGLTYEVSIAAWKADMLTKCPTFMYWDLFRRYETLILIFI
jgi:hypothetical protein